MMGIKMLRKRVMEVAYDLIFGGLVQITEKPKIRFKSLFSGWECKATLLVFVNYAMSDNMGYAIQKSCC